MSEQTEYICFCCLLNFLLLLVSLEKDQLELQWSTEALRPFHAIKTINAYLLRNQTNRCNKRHTWRKDYSCLSVLLIFSRDLSFYFTTVFVPGMVLVTSSFISFWLDVNAVPARVMISIFSSCTFYSNVFIYFLKKGDDFHDDYAQLLHDNQ